MMNLRAFLVLAVCAALFVAVLPGAEVFGQGSLPDGDAVAGKQTSVLAAVRAKDKKTRSLRTGTKVHYRILMKTDSSRGANRFKYTGSRLYTARFDSSSISQAYFSGYRVRLDSLVSLRFWSVEASVKRRRTLGIEAGVFGGITLAALIKAGLSETDGIVSEQAGFLVLGSFFAVTGGIVLIATALSNTGNYDVNSGWRFYSTLPTDAGR